MRYHDSRQIPATGSCSVEASPALCTGNVVRTIDIQLPLIRSHSRCSPLLRQVCTGTTGQYTVNTWELTATCAYHQLRSNYRAIRRDSMGITGHSKPLFLPYIESFYTLESAAGLIHSPDAHEVAVPFHDS